MTFAVIATLTAINAVAAKVGGHIFSWGLAETILNLGGFSAVIWFAIFSLTQIARRQVVTTVPTIMDKWIMMGMLLASCIPFSWAASLGLTGGGLYLVFASEVNSPARSIAIVMIALAGPLFWGPLLLAVIAPVVLPFDAYLAGLIAGLPVTGNIVTFVGGRDSLYVAKGCSSLHNMSIALLIFAVATQLFNRRLTPVMITAGAASAIAVAVVNVLRLAAMASFPKDFDYLHTGTGATLFGYASLAAAIMVVSPAIIFSKRQS